MSESSDSSKNKKWNGDLVPVHGGLDVPVDRMVPVGQRKDFLAEAEIKLSPCWMTMAKPKVASSETNMSLSTTRRMMVT